jgi:predicted amidohydrolase YtcJ
VNHTGTTLLVGGRIYSPVAPDATAMAVREGTVVWVGSDETALTRYGQVDEVVPLDGAFVAPAFVDAHVHVTSAGLLLTGLDLTGCRSLAECLCAVREFAAGRSGVIWGHGWDESRWPERRPPSRAELDEAAGGVPAYLSRIDVHSALVTSALVVRVPEARDADGWSEDGPLVREAHHHVRRVARDSLTPDQRTAAQLAFLRHAAAQGVVSVHECAGPDISGAEDLAALLDLAAPELPEVVGYWGERGAVRRAAELGVRGLAGDLFVDGAIGSRTAALREPYTDAPEACGSRYLDVDEIAEHVVTCTNAGLQAGFHVIGDAAVSAVVDGFAKAETAVGRDALVSCRHRLEHLEMVDAGQARRLASWGVVASMQPLFDDAWGGPGGMYAQRLGPRRGVALNPFALLADGGVELAFGSDAPVTQMAPWRSVRAAVRHRTEGSGLPAEAAFAAHTRGGWRAAGVTDAVTGTLVPGAPAHYAMWSISGDMPPRGLPLDHSAPRCVRTVRQGTTIFDGEVHT